MSALPPRKRTSDRNSGTDRTRDLVQRSLLYWRDLWIVDYTAVYALFFLRNDFQQLFKYVVRLSLPKLVFVCPQLCIKRGLCCSVLRPQQRPVLVVDRR